VAGPSNYQDKAAIKVYAATLDRNAIWREKPPLDPGCEHHLRCLPCVEYRQTVLCTRCGGLDTALSVAVANFPGAFTVDEDGRITRKIAPGDAGAVERLRFMEVPENIIAQIVHAAAG